jgi:hypothetical protein
MAKKALNAVRHGLYMDMAHLQAPEDNPLGKFFKKTVSGLLERFPDPPPALAVVIARNLAFKLLRSQSFMSHTLRSGEEPAPTADLNFLHLSGSMRADVNTLWAMAKETKPTEPKSLEWAEHVKELAEEEAKDDED